MIEFLTKLFDGSDFVRRSLCGNWTPGLILLHNVSDGLIWFSYTAIPAILIYFVRRRKDVPFPKIFWMFGAFIVFCGFTHFMEIVMFVSPVYRLAGLIKLATAGISLATVAALIPFLPVALALKGPTELEELNHQLEFEIHERKKALEELAKRNDELREREDFARSVTESASDAIVSTDAQGRIVFWNKGAQEIFGYVPEEVIGKPLSLLMPQKYREAHQKGFERLSKTGESHVLGKTLEMEGLRKNSTEFPIELRIDAWSAGQKRFFTGIIRDITERRRAEEEFRGLMESAPDAMIIADTDGRVLSLNTHTEKLFGYSRSELLGQPVEILIPERLRALHPSHRAHYAADPKVRSMGSGLPLYGLRKDGTEFPVEISLSPIETRRGSLISTALRDVTERKRAEDHVRTLNLELEAKVRDLQFLNQEVESFGYSVSHDLRAPLRSIHGFSQILLETSAEKLDQRGRHCLDRVCAASERMGELIDDLLKLSRIVRTQIQRQNVDLTAFADKIAEELRNSAPDRKVEFVISRDMAVWGDSRLLKLVLENMMGNAWKFTGKHPQARIEVGREEQEGQPVYFVRDDGAGFDMEFAGQLFGAFQRLHSPDEFEGTGIGLATVQRIVYRHGGQLWAHGEVEKGATFYFTLGS